MRIRTVKPEFWRSEDITKLSMEHRLLYIGLWSYVDDNGVGVDDPRQITADLFALEDDPKSVREFVSEGLRTLYEHRLIDRYVVQGASMNHRKTHLIYVLAWDRHQRVQNPNRPRYPRPGRDAPTPTSGNAESTDELGQVYVGSTDGLPLVTEEQGNRVSSARSGARRRGARTKHEYTEEFETWWALYPRPEGKRPASESFARALDDGVSIETLMTGVRRYTASRRGKDPQYTLHAKTWLNQERWNDGALRAVGSGLMDT